MANIQISALLPVGYDLFNDSASFLNELATEEVENIFGEGYKGCYHKCHSGCYGGYKGHSKGYGGGYGWGW
jgi:hypothetical protein